MKIHLNTTNFRKRVLYGVCYLALPRGNCLITAHPVHLIEPVFCGSACAHLVIAGARKESLVCLIRSILITLVRGLHGRFGFYQKAMGGISPARPTSPRQKARITTSELRRRGNSELASAQLPLSRRLDGFVAKPYQSRDGISLRLLRIREVRFAPIVFSNSGSGCQALQPSSLPGPLFSPR